MCHITTIFAPKLITLFFSLLRQTDCLEVLALLFADQEYLVAFILMASQVVSKSTTAESAQIVWILTHPDPR